MTQNFCDSYNLELVFRQLEAHGSSVHIHTPSHHFHRLHRHHPPTTPRARLSVQTLRPFHERLLRHADRLPRAPSGVDLVQRLHWLEVGGRRVWVLRRVAIECDTRRFRPRSARESR